MLAHIVSISKKHQNKVQGTIPTSPLLLISHESHTKVGVTHPRVGLPIWQSKSIMWTPHDIKSDTEFQCIISALKLDWGSEIRCFTFMNDVCLMLRTVERLNGAGATNPTRRSNWERRK